MNSSEWNHVNLPDQINGETLRLLVENFVRICNVRNESIWGMTPSEWASIFISRIGKEPLFRLIFVFVNAVESSNSCLSEILAQDSVLFAQSIAIGDLRQYYDKYPAAANPPR
jgi:hypothetical protein